MSIFKAYCIATLNIIKFVIACIIVVLIASVLFALVMSIIYCLELVIVYCFSFLNKTAFMYGFMTMSCLSLVVYTIFVIHKNAKRIKKEYDECELIKKNNLK